MHTLRSAKTVVHLLAPAEYGGLESVVTALALGQSAAGDHVTVVPVFSSVDSAPHPLVEALEAECVEVRPIVVSGRDYRGERAAVADILSTTGADVLHTHGYRPDVVDSPIGRKLGVATATTVHGYTGGGWRNRLYEWLQTRSFRHFDGVVVVSAKLRRELIASGVSASRVYLIRNAWSAPASFPDRAATRARLGLVDDGPRVAFVGRLSREKGPDVFLRAAALMRTSDVSFSVVGSGPLASECRDLADELGLSERVTWHGSIPGAGTFLPAFDAIALTSRTEGTPMLLLEAMAAEVPIVATGVGGVPDVVTDEEAQLCDPDAPGSIARALDDTLARSTAAAARARAARIRLDEEFAIAPWVSAYGAMYDSIIDPAGCVGAQRIHT